MLGPQPLLFKSISKAVTINNATISQRMLTCSQQGVTDGDCALRTALPWEFLLFLPALRGNVGQGVPQGISIGGPMIARVSVCSESSLSLEFCAGSFPSSCLGSKPAVMPHPPSILSGLQMNECVSALNSLDRVCPAK